MSTDNVMARVVRKRKIGHFCLLFTVFCLICVVKNAIVKQAADDRDLKEKNRQYVHIGMSLHEYNYGLLLSNDCP